MPFKEEFDGAEKSHSQKPNKGLLGRIRDYTLTNKGKIATTGAATVAAFYLTCTTYLRPDQQGIMQLNWSPFGIFGHAGIQERIYEGGKLAVRIPFIENMHKLPAEVQVINMHVEADQNKLEAEQDNQEQHDAKYSKVARAAHIQTSDGFYVDLDATILYRIADPYKTITRVGGGKLYEDNGIMPRAEPALKASLGRLNPEEFYDPAKRVAQQEEAKKLLNQVLGGTGISVDHVLIRATHYHPDIQKRLEDRKHQDQLIETNKAVRLQNDAQAALSTIVNIGSNNVQTLLETGNAYKTTKEAEQTEYDRKKRAEADRLIQLAEAEKTRLVNNAYTGAGSDLLVAVQMAEVLKGLDTIYIPTGGSNGMNPLDMDKLLKMFDARKK